MSSMYKIDLHTHSIASPDGSLGIDHYRRLLEGGMDAIAITDHNTIEFALDAAAKLPGGRIIVGEEITTAEGEVVGLFLEEAVPAGLSLLETVQLIKNQKGLVYIPHPFETIRKGVALAALDAVAAFVDIIEIYNGRAAVQNRHQQAQAWAVAHGVPGAASSDSHGWYGWGKTYSMVSGIPTVDTLPALLASAKYAVAPPGLRGLLYPKINRIRKVFSRAS